MKSKKDWRAKRKGRIPRRLFPINAGSCMQQYHASINMNKGPTVETADSNVRTHGYHFLDDRRVTTCQDPRLHVRYVS